MLLGIGVEDTHLQLILNIVYAVVGWIFSVTGARLHDKIGRRKMFLAATSGMVVSLSIVAACSAGYVEYGNQTAPTVSIVFIFMFGAIFSAGYTPMQPVYPAEVVSTRMRAKAMGVYKVTNGAASFLNTFVGPIALSSVSSTCSVPVIVRKSSHASRDAKSRCIDGGKEDSGRSLT